MLTVALQHNPHVSEEEGEIKSFYTLFSVKMGQSLGMFTTWLSMYSRYSWRKKLAKNVRVVRMCFTIYGSETLVKTSLL